MKRTSFRFFLIPALVFLAFPGCREAQQNPSEPSEPTGQEGLISIAHNQFEANSMVLGKPEQKAFPQTLEVSGIIDVPPENRAVVSALNGGFVKDISLLVGDQVRKGQRIVSLESPEFLKLQQQYLEAWEQLPYLKAEYERQKTMFSENITSEKVYLQAESQYRTTLAQQNSLKKQLELLNIPAGRVEAGELTSESPVYAPIAGSLTRVNVRKGVFVSPATEIAEIVNNDHLHLELNVYEKDISKLKVGQEIRFRLPEYSENTYAAHVHLIGAAIDEDRTVKVHAHLEEEAHSGFLVGMYVRASIEVGVETAEAPQWAVPESAVVTQQGKSYILLLQERTDTGYLFRQAAVETGTPRGGYIPVSSPALGADTEVLFRGAFNLVAPE
ncbi:efflux RND transporter periplasmic adaptor subunit [Robiginitalea sediminis]|uniref:efflux RND transporter periplasmic adaptor subunit n=1 Tax=Robiginitalea sediminis TaxID=1982593 RepID=UPI000B4B6D77|nr:efflux RND transporter periplasmic adaptor subunit [Robiginitalea sediminis]